MKHSISKYILPIVIAVLSLSACHNTEDWDNDAVGNFEALWSTVDQHYCFFKEKGIDWDSIYNVYRPQVTNGMSQSDLFDVCANMLNELKDGHVNLISYFNTSYYRKWWSDYPQNYDQRLVEQYYLNYDYKTVGSVKYYTFEADSVGYIRYPSFSSAIGQSTLDVALYSMRECYGLIIDVRDNGGGDMDNIERLVSRFLSEPIRAGYICHKTGVGHDDFSEPYEYSYDPAYDHVRWLRKVVVLTNRSTYSAANNFVSVMKTLPHVTIVGATTGGGSGMPYSSELPNGWAMRMSACKILDPNGNDTETGVTPTEGCEVDLDPELALSGVDTMLDFAIDFLRPASLKKSQSSTD
jgi:hypothetical protein